MTTMMTKIPSIEPNAASDKPLFHKVARMRSNVSPRSFALRCVGVACILLSLNCATTAVAQVYVVSADGAVFKDGSTVVANVPRNTKLWSLQRKDGWLLAVEPQSGEPNWISESYLSRFSYSQQALTRINELDKQEDILWEYGKQSPLTSRQHNETIAWATEIRSLRGDFNAKTADNLINAGRIVLRRQSFRKAAELFNQALAIQQRTFGNSSKQVASAHMRLADIFLETGELVKVAKSAKAAAIIRTKIYGQDHPNTLATMVPLADALYAASEYQDAFGIYQQVATGFDEHHGPEHIQATNARARMAQLSKELGKPKQALEIFQRNLIGLRKQDPPSPITIAKTQLQIAILSIDSNDPFSAKRARESIDQFKRDFPDQQDYAISQQRELVGVLLETGVLNDRHRAFAFLDANIRHLRTKLRKELWEIPAEKQAEYLSYAGGHEFFASVSLADDFKDDDVMTEKSIEWMINAKGIVQETQVAQAVGLSAAGRDAFAKRPWVELDQIQAALPDDGVYVDIVRYLYTDYRKGTNQRPRSKYIAWIATKTGSPKLVDLGNARQVDQAVIRLRSALVDSVSQIKEMGELASFQATKPMLENATRVIWEPIRKHFGDAKVVIISPDQATWLLPWAALLNPDGSFVIEQYQIQLELTGRDLVREPVKTADETAVVFADPEYGDPVKNANASSGFKIGPVEQLDFSSQEAATVAPLIGKLIGTRPKLLIGEEARESDFKELSQPSIIVLSTHGFFLNAEGQVLVASGIQDSTIDQTTSIAKNPLLQCGLMLADANAHTSIEKMTNDGVLTGAEIARANLRGTKLAVLSACETGVGSLDATGGVIGLRSAFHAAGTQCVLGSLWSVSDRATAKLMQGFFSDLVENRDVRRAIQATQVKQIESRRQRNAAAHPFFWAAFNLSGHTSFGQ